MYRVFIRDGVPESTKPKVKILNFPKHTYRVTRDGVMPGYTPVVIESGPTMPLDTPLCSMFTFII